jgi:glycine/D-amino acid oxidase-like deaminating enzyme
MGLEAELVTTQHLAQQYPLLSLDDLDPAATHLVEHSAGYFDPSGALVDMAESCKQAGVELAFRRAVADVELHPHGNRVQSVQFGDGSQVSVGSMINCLGPWCGQLSLSNPLVKQWDVQPVRIQAVHKPVTQPDFDLRRLPIVCDGPNGVYFRPQLGHDHIVVSTILPSEEQEVVNPDAFNTAADPDSRTRLLSGLHARVPSLAARGAVHGYAALYTMNRRDGHPLVGRGTTAVDNYFVANAFTGHGFKLSPVVGDLLAYQLTNLTVADGGSTAALQRFGDLLRPDRDPLWDKVSVVA